MDLKQSKFTDGSILQRLKEIESLPENIKNIEKMKTQMTGSSLQHSLAWIILVVVTFIAYIFIKKAIFMVILFTLLVAPEFFKPAQNAKYSYLQDFVLPTLREVLPNTTVQYYSGIEVPYFRLSTPFTESYHSFFHISFGDEVNTHFCNLHSTHETVDSKGNRHIKTDFKGQVLMVKYPTGLNGYLRIIPTKQLMFGVELLNGYKEKQLYETKIETEDIRFNETHEVYCMDELGTRTLLNPYILNLLTRWADVVPVGIYIDNETVVLSFATGRFLFEEPKFVTEIGDLSLSEEYEELQEELLLMYELLGMMNT